MPQWSYGWLIILLLTATPGWAEDPEFVRVVLTPSEDVQVSGEDAGLVREVHVRVGQQVQRGEVLLSLTNAEARIKLDQALAAREIAVEAARNTLPVELAKKTLAVARSELDRAEAINQRNSGTVTAAEVDRLRLTAERAQLELQQAEHSRHIRELEAHQAELAVKLAEVQLARRQIVAPCSGTVVQLHLRPGEWLNASDAACRLIDCSRLRAEGRIPFPGNQLQPGQSVALQFAIDGSEQEIPGEVTFVSPELESVRGERLIWIELDNANGQLSPGMSGRFRLIEEAAATP